MCVETQDFPLASQHVMMDSSRMTTMMSVLLYIRRTTIRSNFLCLSLLLSLVTVKIHAFAVLSGSASFLRNVVANNKYPTLIECGGCLSRTRTTREFSRVVTFVSKRANNQQEDLTVKEEGEEDENDFFEATLPDSSRDQVFSRHDIESLTVAQLKQQLRLRGLKVSGRKAELVERFLHHQGTNTSPAFFSHQVEESDANAAEARPTDHGQQPESRARKFASEHGKELVDVSGFVDPEDSGKSTRTLKETARGSGDEGEGTKEDRGSNPEVWGAEARMVDDYGDDRIVVDCLSLSVVEFQGSNQSYVQAFVAASRDALKPYLAGGRNPNDSNSTRGRTDTPAEQRLRDIQNKREQAAKRPIRYDDEAFGLDNAGDETGIYKDVLHRDYSDWGAYTATGAQLSASEVQGLLLLSDVYGAFNDDTRALAEKIAFECQPVVVMVPDLFRGLPWTGATTSGTNELGQTYEQWRALHSDLRVNIDIRAAAACLRERYGVSSVVVWGTCYGGGRALEAAAGWFPDRNIHDVDGNVGPPPVDPMACEPGIQHGTI